MCLICTHEYICACMWQTNLKKGLVCWCVIKFHLFEISHHNMETQSEKRERTPSTYILPLINFYTCVWKLVNVSVLYQKMNFSTISYQTKYAYWGPIDERWKIVTHDVRTGIQAEGPQEQTKTVLSASHIRKGHRMCVGV